MAQYRTFELWDREEKKVTSIEATKVGEQWKAVCPKHPDKKASLSINGEKKVFNCFGCDFHGHLNDPNYKSKNGKGKKILATYNYQDEVGKLLFQIVRYDTKDFTARRPDGNGGWIYKGAMKEIQPVPYRLPEVLKAQKVLNVEGEKDADNVHAVGFTATTNPFGAGNWKAEFNQYLNGKDVILCPDNDPKGIDHMKQVAASLNGTTKSLKWLELPGLPPQGDISDWLSQFKDTSEAAKQLSILIEAAKLYILPNVKEEPPIDVSQFKELTVEDLTKILGLTIVKDDTNKILTLLCQVSAYTEDSQFNISYNAPSSTGKSYIPLEVDRYLPKEDVIELGYCSPTAFFHDYGIWDKERKVSIVDLSHKVIIFLDQPHMGLLERLRPILSHDRKEIQSKITDRKEKYGMRTKNIIIRGYPAVIFCSAKVVIDEQEATRFLLLSPETTQEKIKASIFMKVKREADPDLFKRTIEENEDRISLKNRILAIKQTAITEILLDDPDKIRSIFIDKYPNLRPKHSRDIGRVISIIKALALINLWFRTRSNDGKTMVTNEQDMNNAFEIWSAISEPQELNLSPYVYDIYLNVLVPLWQEKYESSISTGPIGITKNEILRKYYDVFRKPLGEQKLRKEIISMLNQAGLIYEEADPGDKRVSLIFQCLMKKTEE